MSLIICCYPAVLPLLFARRFGKKDSRIKPLRVQLSRNSGDSVSSPRLLRGGGGTGGGTAQFRGVVAAGEEGLDVAARLPQPLAVFDEGDAHETLAVFAEPGAGRDRDIGPFQQQ